MGRNSIIRKQVFILISVLISIVLMSTAYAGPCTQATGYDYEDNTYTTTDCCNPTNSYWGCPPACGGISSCTCNNGCGDCTNCCATSGTAGSIDYYCPGTTCSVSCSSPTGCPTECFSPENIPGIVSYWSFDIADGSDATTAPDTVGTNDGIVTNGAAHVTSDIKGEAYRFDGNNDYIQVIGSNDLNLNQYTLSAWVNVDIHKNYNAIITKGDDSKENYEILANLNAGGYTTITWTDNTRDFIVIPSDSMPAGSWAFVTTTYDGNAMKAYINGVEVVNYPVAKTPKTNNKRLLFGNEGSSTGRYFDGLIDEVGIWNRALTQQEIQGIYNYYSFVPPPCTPTNGGIEICDSIDNNCDGKVDEGGVCAPICTPTNGGIEACDNIDNDCDGGIDENLDFTYTGGCCQNPGTSTATPGYPIESQITLTASDGTTTTETYQGCGTISNECLYDGTIYNNGENLYFATDDSNNYFYLPRICGENNDWQEMEQKWVWSNKFDGYCNIPTDCLVRPQCDDQHSITSPYYCNPSDPSINSFPPRCISDGESIGDHYCEQGNWTSKTKFVALQLMDIVEDYNEYTLFCDSYQNTLNDINYDINSLPVYYRMEGSTGGTIDCDIIGEIAPLEGDLRSFSDEIEPCVNNICVLTYDHDYSDSTKDKVVLGASLNTIEPTGTSYLTDFLGILEDTTDCSNAIAANDGQFNQCANNRVWWNEDLSLAIYTKDSIGINLQPLNFWEKFVQFLKNPIFTILTFFRSLSETAGQTQIDFGTEDWTQIDLIKDFNKLYLSRYYSKSVIGIVENISSGKGLFSTTEGLLGIKYQGLVSDVCSSIDNYNYLPNMNLHCISDQTTSTQLVSANFIANPLGMQTWLALTAKTRLQGPERACSSVEDDICPVQNGCSQISNDPDYDVDCVVCTDTCSSLGYECGVSTICNEAVDCGPTTTSCTATYGTCSVTGTQTCSPLYAYDPCISVDPRIDNCAGKQCGTDSCGGSCGTCAAGQTCDAAGQCVSTCTDTCSSLGYQCGTQTVCSLSTDCGTCAAGQICDAAGQCVVPSGVFGTSLDNNLVSYWSFDIADGSDATTAPDKVGTNDGIVTNGAAHVTSDIKGEAYRFDGNNDHIQVTGSNDLNLNQYTLSAWVNVDIHKNYNAIITKGEDQSENYEILVNLNGGGYNTIKWSDGSRDFIVIPSNNIPAGTWVFVVATYDGNAMKVYIDNGREVVNYPVAKTPKINAKKLLFGREGKSTGRYFDGLIDEVGIWNRALTQQEIQDLYNYYSP